MTIVPTARTATTASTVRLRSITPHPRILQSARRPGLRIKNLAGQLEAQRGTLLLIRTPRGNRIEDHPYPQFTSPRRGLDLRQLLHPLSPFFTPIAHSQVPVLGEPSISMVPRQA